MAYQVAKGIGELVVVKERLVWLKSQTKRFYILLK
jgi:hypothetical protein